MERHGDLGLEVPDGVERLNERPNGNPCRLSSVNYCGSHTFFVLQSIHKSAEGGSECSQTVIGRRRVSLEDSQTHRGEESECPQSKEKVREKTYFILSKDDNKDGPTNW